LLTDLESDNEEPETMVDSERSKSKMYKIDPSIALDLKNSLINLVTIDHKLFRNQLMYISAQFSSYLLAQSTGYNFKRNTRSMPMKYESINSLNLNFPLVPDNHNYSKIFECLHPTALIDIFYGILLEERMLLITDCIGQITVAIEALFELVFPFNPIDYRIISSLPEDMHLLLGLPCPFVTICTTEVFEVIKNDHLRDHKEELMIIDIKNQRISWDRKVDYPQPHTQYFYNTLILLSNLSPVHFGKITRSNSVTKPTEEILGSLKKYISDNLLIKQAFIN
jgi:hypothetical protein